MWDMPFWQVARTHFGEGEVGRPGSERPTTWRVVAWRCEGTVLYSLVPSESVEFRVEPAIAKCKP